jgi:pimeloyl-ACP methyl ester carboxylesterase
MSKDIRPFRIEVPDAELDDLRRRLRQTRWPEPESVDDWSQGTPLAYTRALCDYWLTGYDWRAGEARLNRFAQFRTEIDGVDIHFIHVRSAREDASAARLYWESFRKPLPGPVTVPVGCSIFPKEIFRPSRRWAEQRFSRLHYWHELDKGGHFAAFEQPVAFVAEVRAAFRPLRQD